MIRLLVADDSALMRRLISELFVAQGDFEVEVARDGVEALEKLSVFRPDVVTLDINMPRLDGLAALDRIMVERPTPVVMVSSLTQEDAEETVAALGLGAVGALPKPSGALSLKMDDFGPRLVAAVRAAAQARVSRARRLAERVRRSAPPLRPRVRARPGRGLVLIGCSTGGPSALDAVLGDLPADFPWPIVIAQHMPAAFTGALARRLDRLTPLSVMEVSRATPLRPGEVYIGRGDADLLIADRPGGLAAVAAPQSPDYLWHPSVDRLVDSALAQGEAARMVGVLMTGMGNDGAAAMTRLRAAGGRTLAEAQTSAVVWGMPGELVRMGGAERVEPLERIGRALCEMAGAR